MANEKRLIDADALIKEHCKNCDWPKHGSCPHLQDKVAMCYAVNLVNEAPTIDAVEVVRCKDCEHGELDTSDDSKWYLCRYDGSVWYKGNHFCSHGKRRTCNDTTESH